MKHIALFPNGTKDKGFALTQMVADILISHGARLTLPASCALPPQPGIEVVSSTQELLDRAQLVITLGGDGTILNIAADAARKNIPILGINLGRVGFMAELEVKKLDLLCRLFEDKYTIEERMMLDVRLNDGRSQCVLNDVVITARRRQMLDLALSQDEKLLGTFRADGLVIATPTGSTAYCLSAGGPVVDPRLQLMLAVPVCSHSLGARPIVFGPDTRLQADRPNLPARVTLDGKDTWDLGEGDRVQVCRSNTVTRLVQLCDRQFYTAVRSYFS